ncbi:MAG: hypothetical protein LBP26_07865 [Clostridiales bacterium]|jgi:hypothetical protein|nr:hypothetical protein [Clostridiales bacterium]
MSINPFELKSGSVDKGINDWKKIFVKPYDKRETDPYTKIRIILCTGAEYEQVWFGHRFHRCCADNDLRRELALLRRVEQQQQKRLAFLKPADENILETTIGYEQLAVDLTAVLAQNEPDAYVKAALDFALLEDFDHLYRYADLLEMEYGVYAEQLVGRYTEIMPGRPTIAEHRYPFDDVKRPSDASASLATKLCTNIITAAEQQTMNYYMNVGATYVSDLGRKLYLEIAMIEEQHVTHYGSLLDPAMTWLENLLMHEYTECYLYYSMLNDEVNPHVKKIWEAHFDIELSHLHKAAELLKKYEKKEWQQVIPNAEFPKLLAFTDMQEANKAYVRGVLGATVQNTAVLEEYTKVARLPDGYEFFKYNDAVNRAPSDVASHGVIDKYIAEAGIDYRFEERPHPVKALSNRKKDNVDVGRACPKADR